MPLPRPAPGTTRWWVVGVVGCLAAVGVIVWWGVVATVGSVRPEVTGYRVESDTAVVVEYDLHRPAGVAVRLPGQRARRRPQPGRHGRGRRARAGADVGAPRWCRVRTSVRAVTGVVDTCTRVLATP